MKEKIEEKNLNYSKKVKKSKVNCLLPTYIKERDEMDFHFLTVQKCIHYSLNTRFIP